MIKRNVWHIVNLAVGIIGASLIITNPQIRFKILGGIFLAAAFMMLFVSWRHQKEENKKLMRTNMQLTDAMTTTKNVTVLPVVEREHKAITELINKAEKIDMIGISLDNLTSLYRDIFVTKPIRAIISMTDTEFIREYEDYCGWSGINAKIRATETAVFPTFKMSQVKKLNTQYRNSMIIGHIDSVPSWAIVSISLHPFDTSKCPSIIFLEQTIVQKCHRSFDTLWNILH